MKQFLLKIVVLTALVWGMPHPLLGQALPPQAFQKWMPESITPPLESFQGVPVGEIFVTGNGRTKPRIVLQEILMQPGEPFDIELARESMRNLRTFAYLGDAEIVAHPDSASGTVNLEVQVKDSWPWVGAVIPNFAGGQTELLMIAANGNLLGRGQTIGFSAFLSSEVANSYSFFFLEPRMLGSRWGVALDIGEQGEVGPRNRFTVYRPLFSLAARWGYEFSIFNESDEFLLYDDGVEISDYYRQRAGGTAAVIRSFPRAGSRTEVGLRYLYRDDEFRQASGWNGIIPENQDRASLTLETTAEKLNYVEDRYFNLMGPVEDLRLGLRGTVRAGAALKVLGSDRNYPELGAGFRWFTGTQPSGYVLLEGSVDTRIENEQFANTVLTTAAKGWRKLPGQGMLAAHLQFTMLDKMENLEQLLLDSPRGLRGYAAFSYEGQRRFLTNLEWRQPFWRLSWMTVASVLFADTGIIWSEVKPLDEQPYLVGVGAGARLGFPGLLGAPVTRLDFGYGVETRSWEFSFGFDQRF